ncbi:hypothetical protein MSG28_006093, partial [Choristoneura fumiferana]
MDGYENVHTKCIEEFENLKLEFEKYKAQNVKKDESGDVKNEIANLKSERLLLKEKLETYGMMLEDERLDKADTVKACEETRIQSLEKQVVTQRDRYAALLDETDSYIRAKNDRSRKDVMAPPHMLHYAHEDHQREATIEKERFKEVVRTLKEEIDRPARDGDGSLASSSRDRGLATRGDVASTWHKRGVNVSWTQRRAAMDALTSYGVGPALLMLGEGYS